MKLINNPNSVCAQSANHHQASIDYTRVFRKNASKSLILSISLLSFTFCMPATAIGTNIEKQLGSLEQRFLGHSIDSIKSGEPLDKRVARVEKLVFGEAKEGAIASRIQSLSIAVNGASVDSSASNSTNDRTSQDASYNSSKNVEASATNNSESNKAATKPQVDPYPRVGALEKAIVGNVFPGDDISARLARMEEKSFGKQLDSEALSDRTDALQKYIEKKTRKKLFVPPPDTEVANAGEVDDQEQEKRSKVPGIINAVSTALFGPTGNGTMGGINTGMMGFGGIRVRNRADVQREELARKQQEEPERKIPEENPLVRESSPPPANSKMQTKIGWCEVQLYGHTFPTTHLTKRLEKINGELEYKPGTKGINLMDDLDTMVKLVYSKSASRSVSTNGQQKTQ